jgi:hypothetical protein
VGGKKNAAPFFSFCPQLLTAFLAETLKPDMLGIVSYQPKVCKIWDTLAND